MTLSKLLAAGMAEAWPRVTSRPAELLHLVGEPGTLAAGACADIVGLQVSDERVLLQDVNGNEREGNLWQASLVMRSGQLAQAPSQ